MNTPGVLVIKKKHCTNNVPSQPGGGTVFFVTKDSHRFLSHRSDREEGGTPDIVTCPAASSSTSTLMVRDTSRV